MRGVKKRLIGQHFHRQHLISSGPDGRISELLGDRIEVAFDERVYCFAMA